MIRFDLHFRVGVGCDAWKEEDQCSFCDGFGLDGFSKKNNEKKEASVYVMQV